MEGNCHIPCGVILGHFGPFLGHFGSFWSFLTKMDARHKKVFWNILDRFWAVLGCFGYFDPEMA